MNITSTSMGLRLRVVLNCRLVLATTISLFSLIFTPEITAQTPYCVSKSQSPWQEWIGRVQINTLDNTSDKARADRYVVGYSDWTDKTTTLTRGQNYPLSITPALSWLGYQTNLFFHVWIDFNGNGLFEDTEKVLEQTNGNQLVTSTVTIPTTALIGARGMRVSMKKDAYSTSCETFAAGEVEDYTVQIVDGTPPTTTNIVQNGSFEQYTTCPVTTSQINLATGWQALYDDPIANAEYNNTNPLCNYRALSGIAPKTGSGCASFWVSSGSANLGLIEGIQGLLTTPMLQNQTYTLSLNAARVTTGSFATVGKMAVFGIKSGTPIKTNNIGSASSDPENVAQYGTNAVKLASFDLNDVQGYTLKTAQVSSVGFNIGAIIITRDISGAAGGMYLSLDDVSLVPSIPVTCLLTAPSKGMATNVTTNTATIKWQRVPTATNYNYELRYDNTGGAGALGLIASGTTTDTFVNVNFGAGRYQAFVQANCSSSTSAWSKPISFTAPEFPCNQGALTTLNENFEGGITGSLPACWRNSIYRDIWNIEANVDVRSTARGTMGNASRRIIMYRSSTADSTLMMAITPELSNIGAGTHRLRFKAANTWGSAYAGIGRIQIGTISNVFDPATFTPIGAPTTILDNIFREYTIDFANYRSSDRNIAFKYVEGGGDASFRSLEIDDVIWEAAAVNPCDTDRQSPIYIFCPANIVLTTTGTTAIATWATPIATDNCGIVTTYQPYTSGRAFPIGTTMVHYNAVDAKGNIGACIFNVTVVQQIDTTNNVCANPSANIVGGANAITISGVTTGAGFIQIFNSAWNLVVSQSFNGTTKTIPNITAGVYNIKVTVLGAGGTWPSVCVAEASVVVSSGTNPCANDVTPPVFTNCPANMAVTTTGTTAFVFLPSPQVTDNCTGIPSVSNNIPAGFAFPIGATTVIYTAKDISNNTATCTFVVTVTAPLSCGQPTKGMATNVTTNSATIKWQRVPNAINYSYEVRVENAAGSGAIGLFTSGTATDTFFNVNFVNSGRFQVFVKANCSSGSSDWSKPISFTAPEFTCNQGALTALNENFESATTGSLPPCWRNSIYRDFWNIEANIDVRATSRGTLGNTSRRIIMYRSSTADSALIMAITPELSNIGAGTHRLRFKAANTWGTPYAGVGRVQIGTISNVFDPATFTPIGAPTMILDNTFREYIIDFANYRGSDRNIVFKYVESGGDVAFRSLEIDDVIWEAAPVITTTNDIGLTITSTSTTYRQWTPITVRVSAKNNGTTTMTNVKIDLKRPVKTATGGAKTPSVGTFNDYCPGGIECSEWVIPSLAAGATATLDTPFFVLDATLPIVVTTNLLASTPSDGTVSNNTATISIAPTALLAPNPVLLSTQKPTQLIPIVVQKIAPNPTEGELIVKLESLDAREVTFDFFNTFGQLVKSEKRAVEKGVNRVEFDVFDLEQGVHLIVPSTTKGYKVPTKFVKM